MAGDGDGACWRIQARSAVSGELLAELALPPASTVRDLWRVLLQQDPNLEPMDLLLRGEVLAQAEQSLDAAGFQDGAAVDVVRRQWPGEFVNLTHVPLSNEGYHCHDTWFARPASQDEGCFWGAHERGFQGVSYAAHKARIRSGKASESTTYCTEVAAYDLTSWADKAEAMTEDREAAFSKIVLTARMPEEIARVPSRILAVDRAGRFLATWKQSSPQQADVLGFIHMHGVGCEWRAAYVPDPDRRWCPMGAAWVGVRLFLSGVFFDEGGTCDVLVELTEDEGSLHERRWVVQPGATMEGAEVAHYRGMQLLGADSAGEALWVATARGVGIAPLDTLQSRQVVRWDEWAAAEEQVHLGHATLDPLSRDIYVFLDRSIPAYRADRHGGQCSSACRVHRLRPTSARSSVADLSYFGPAPGEHVCDARFGIDGFSDSFCITEVGYCARGDRLLLVDACADLWELRLRDLRQS